MDVENELRRIYRNPANPGSLGGIDRLLRRAQELNMPGVNRRSVENFLIPTHYTGQPEKDTLEIEPT